MGDDLLKKTEKNRKYFKLNDNEYNISKCMECNESSV